MNDAGKTKAPDGWVEATLGDVCTEPQYGYTTKAASAGDLHLLRTTDITSGRIDWQAVPYCFENPLDEGKYLLRDGDIVISRAGSIGVSHLVRQPEKSVFASYLIRFKPLIDAEFFRYYLESRSYWNAISEKKLGIAIPNVNASKLKTIRFPLPPICEQRRIVTKLEELFSKLDNGVENLNRAREQLNVYRQALLKHAFEGKLTAQWRVNRPNNWTQTTLGDQLAFLTSGSRGWAKYYAKYGDIFIRAQNLKHDRLDLDDIAYVSLPENVEGMRTRVRVGDLLITITGANVTKSGFVKGDIGPAYVSQHVALTRPIQGMNSEFLYWFLVAEAAGRKQLNALAYGAGKPGLNLENIRSVRISLPCAEEQAEIVCQLNSALSIAEDLNNQLEAQLVKSEALRHSILNTAFSGRLVAQDQNDEPACVLLERITAEKQTDNKKERRKDAA